MTLSEIGQTIEHPFPLLGPALLTVALLALTHAGPPSMDAGLLPIVGPMP